MLYKDWYEIFKIELHFMKIKFYEENKTEIWVQVEVSFVVFSHSVMSNSLWTFGL